MEPELWLLVLLLGDCALASDPALLEPLLPAPDALPVPPTWASV